MYEKALDKKEAEREAACVIKDSKHAQFYLAF